MESNMSSSRATTPDGARPEAPRTERERSMDPRCLRESADPTSGAPSGGRSRAAALKRPAGRLLKRRQPRGERRLRPSGKESAESRRRLRRRLAFERRRPLRPCSDVFRIKRERFRLRQCGSPTRRFSSSASPFVGISGPAGTAMRAQVQPHGALGVARLGAPHGACDKHFRNSFTLGKYHVRAPREAARLGRESESANLIRSWAVRGEASCVMIRGSQKPTSARPLPSLASCVTLRAMKIDKFTSRHRRPCRSRRRSLASGSPEILPEHLLAALLQQQTGWSLPCSSASAPSPSSCSSGWTRSWTRFRRCTAARWALSQRTLKVLTRPRRSRKMRTSTSRPSTSCWRSPRKSGPRGRSAEERRGHARPHRPGVDRVRGSQRITSNDPEFAVPPLEKYASTSRPRPQGQARPGDRARRGDSGASSRSFRGARRTTRC